MQSLLMGIPNSSTDKEVNNVCLNIPKNQVTFTHDTIYEVIHIMPVVVDFSSCFVQVYFLYQYPYQFTQRTSFPPSFNIRPGIHIIIFVQVSIYLRNVKCLVLCCISVTYISECLPSLILIIQ